jgi:hypothetical protein
MEGELMQRSRLPTKKLATYSSKFNKERDTYEIDLTDLDGLDDNEPVLLVNWNQQPDESIDLSNDEPRQGVTERQLKFDRGMLKEGIAGILAITFSLLFFWVGYPVLILPLLGMIVAYYFGNLSK